jgi:hypothetical protein
LESFREIDYKLSMPKTPKPEADEKRENWSDDQKRREYYYDDAHGYEKYEPSSEEDVEDEEGDEGDRSAKKEARGQSPPSELANVVSSAR